jgi:energy-coupling factor transporter transmembrane protein EcfT
MKFLNKLGALFVKYLALVFLLIALVLVFTWALPAKWADGSGWVVGILVAIALFIMWLSRRNTGKVFTNESGGH